MSDPHPSVELDDIVAFDAEGAALRRLVDSATGAAQSSAR